MQLFPKKRELSTHSNCPLISKITCYFYIFLNNKPIFGKLITSLRWAVSTLCGDPKRATCLGIWRLSAYGSLFQRLMDNG